MKKDRTTYGKKKLYQCNICPASFEAPSLLRKHFVVHGKKKTYPCGVCGKGFSREDSLKMHLKHIHRMVIAGQEEGLMPNHGEHDTGDDKHADEGHKCNLCGQTFGYKSTL